MKPEVVYHGRHVRWSLIWLGLALMLASPFLVVYFTTPQPAPSQIVMSLALGLPPFAMSLFELGKSSGLVLNPQTRQLNFIQGFFSERTSRVYSYDAVRDIYLTSTREDEDTALWNIHLRLEDDSEIVLEDAPEKEAGRVAVYLRSCLGLRINSRPLGSPPWS